MAPKLFLLITLVVLFSEDVRGTLDAKIGMIFHNMDLDKDFYITQDEIGIYFGQYDSQGGDPGSVVIDLAEYKAGWAKYGDSDAQMEHNFNTIDVNNDNVLTILDLGAMFSVADTNRDYKLDFTEFDHYMRTNLYV